MIKAIIIVVVLIILGVIAAIVINQNSTENSSTNNSTNSLTEVSGNINSDDSDSETPLADEELAHVDEPEPHILDIGMSGSKFNPAKIKIKVGETVTWTNNDSVQHTVTATDGLFNSGTLTRGQNFQYNFTTTGIYNYYCELHGVVMSGTVIVE